MRHGRFVSIILLLAGCAAAGSDRPARIIDPTPASRAALQAALNSAFGDHDVTLAEDALTHSSRLVIDHVVRRDEAGKAIMGRELTRPVVFELVKRGDQCVLVRQSDGAHWLLADTACVVE
jgi:hypothetical protein